MTGRLPVVFAPLALQPDVGRVFLSLPEGMTIEEIIGEVLADVPDSVLDRVVVTTINGRSSARVPRRVWHRVRPRAGTQVMIMIAPGRSALNLLLSIAAIAVSAFIFPAGAAGIFGLGLQGSRALLTFGITALGGLLLNALFPVKKEKEEKPTYAVSGWSNEYRPDAVVPKIFGKLRYAPPLATFSYIEVVGDILYNRMVVIWGYGPVALSELKNGETELTKYDEIELEHRYGYPTDEPLTLYTQQMVEEKVSTDLVREFQRDDAGNPLPGEWLAPVDEKPIQRTTARDTAYAIVILSFPSGLGYIDSKNKKIPYLVVFRVRIKKEPDGTWETRPNITVRAKKFAGFFRALRFDFAERGVYTIELTRLSPSEQPEGDVGTYSLLCTWAVLQSFRPEYPFNFSKPVAMTAIRVKSTYQLNGALDSLNGIVESIEPAWNGTAWVAASTRNPAAHALYALRGPMLYRPVPDEDIDLDWFAEWHQFCVDKGLKYDRAHDFDESLGERLAAIGAAGRAVVRWNGRKWTGTIDRPREIPADDITPRNSSGLKASASYFEPPHGHRIQFLDETNKYQPASRVVPMPGHVGDVEIVEDMEMPGKTDPDEIWIEARRRQYELLNRSVTYTATKLGLAGTATTGDLVRASRDIVRRTMASARVLAVRGDLVQIDEVWTMEEGTDYAIRWRVFDEDDTIGESIVRTIATQPGETDVVRLTGAGEAPVAGDLLMFGPAGSDSYRLIVVDIERGRDNSSILTMLPEAAVIDELTDAEEPPVWSGRVGAEIEYSTDPPLAPRFTSIVSGTEGTGNANGLRVSLQPGRPSAIIVAEYEVQHRLVGAGAWSGPVVTSAAEATADIAGYTFGDDVQIRARAVSIVDVSGPYTSTITTTIGDQDFPFDATFNFGDPSKLPLIL